MRPTASTPPTDPAAPAQAPAPTAPPSGDESAPAVPAQLWGPWTPRQWLLALVGSLLVLCSHPRVWQGSSDVLWYPPLGLGLALVAWLGAPILAAIALAILLVSLPHGFPGVLEAAMVSLQLVGAWSAYRLLGQGRRTLDDPHSATYFLLLVPGLVLTVSAFVWAWCGGWEPWLQHVLALWLTQALSVLALTPALLTVATPWLDRHGLIRGDTEEQGQRGDAGESFTWGDAAELSGLALGAAVLGVLLIARLRAEIIINWSLLSILLLVVVWATLRQGLRGGTLTAAAVALTSLWDAGLVPMNLGMLPVQGYLLALCSVALLVGASFTWIRGSEARYRQLLGHIPVMLCSARWLDDRQAGTRHAQITFASAASRTIFGCAPEELHGDFEGWLGRVHPEDRELVLAAHAQLQRQKQPVICEYRLNAQLLPLPRALESNGQAPLVPLRPSVRERWVRETLAPYYDERGALNGWEGVLEDITEPRELAQTLRRTTNMLHALVANLPAGVIFVQGQTGQPILVNARARQLLGQREDPAAGIAHWPRVYRLHRPDGTLYPWEDLPVYRALQRGLNSMRDDIVVHRPDGRIIPLITWGAPIDLGLGDRNEAAVWVFEDLTALHQAEAARMESEARLRTIIETMAEGLLVQDQSGEIVEHNPAACAILGIPAEQLRSQRHLAPAEGCLREDGSPFPRAEQPDVVCLRTSAPVRDVVLGIPWGQTASGEGRTRWILVNCVPLTGRALGKRPLTPRVVTTFADITLYRQALAAARASEQRFRELLESLPLLVVQLDERERILYCNPPAQQLLGDPASAVLGSESWQRALHEADVPSFRDALARALLGEADRIELRYRLLNGTEHTGYALVHPLRHHAGPLGATVVIVDMTLQRRLEAEIDRVHRLDLTGRLASGVVHDFNNLLTAILNLAYVARQHTDEQPTLLEDLQSIQSAAEQAGQLARQLLAFSKQRKVEHQPVAVNSVVQRTLAILRSSLTRNVSVERVLQNAALHAFADESQLQQIVMNLCLNARDAMPQGGKIIITTARHVEPAPVRDGESAAPTAWITIAVRDSGQGMDAATRAKIFEPFFTTKEKGTGLGLTVVRQLVESFQGRIEVTSEPGQGTCFTIWLPECVDAPSLTPMPMRSPRP